MFPKHYHPDFARTSPNLQRHIKVPPTHQSHVEREEDEDRRLYGGLLDTYSSERYAGAYVGQYAWMRRVDQLRASVNACNFGESQFINFHQSSNLLLLNASKSDLVAEDSNQALFESKSLGETQTKWYEQPLLSSMSIDLASRENFVAPFISGMQKPAPEIHDPGLQSNMDGLSPSVYYYKNHCILPTAASLLNEDTSVIQLQFASGVVVAYFGSKEVSSEEVGPFSSIRANVPVTGLAVYHTDSLSYSATR